MKTPPRPWPWVLVSVNNFPNHKILQTYNKPEDRLRNLRKNSYRINRTSNISERNRRREKLKVKARGGWKGKQKRGKIYRKVNQLERKGQRTTEMMENSWQLLRICREMMEKDGLHWQVSKGRRDKLKDNLCTDPKLFGTKYVWTLLPSSAQAQALAGLSSIIITVVRPPIQKSIISKPGPCWAVVWLAGSYFSG